MSTHVKLVFSREYLKKNNSKTNRILWKAERENFKKGGFLAVVIGNLEKCLEWKFQTKSENVEQIRKEAKKILALLDKLKKKKLIWRGKKK